MDKGSEKEGGGVGKGKGKASLSEIEPLSALNLSGNRGSTIGPNTLLRQLNSSTNNSSSSSLLLIPTFDNLRRLRIDGCNTLKHVLPISLSQALQQLEALVISSCSDLQQIIVNNNKEKTEASCKTLFPRLKNLELNSLQKLSMVSTDVFLYDWPSLEAFKIQKCPNLKRFPVNLRTATKLRGIEVKERWGEWFDGLEWDDSLASDATKLCFLLCCMFPQGSIISRDDLILYMVGEGLFGDIYNLSEARNKLGTHMERLKESRLLSLLHNNIEEGKDGCVKMYDDGDDDRIRDMSISIASKERYGFIVESGGALTHWLDGEYLKCKRLSLMQNRITRLPNRPDCSQLITLSLRGNEDLDILDGFFQEMKSLKTLDLENTYISSIPSSLQCLVDLRVLRISLGRGRDRDQPLDVSLLGKLKNLEILHLQDSEVHKLPKEIGELTKLKSLNLSRNRHLTIPRNTLSGLFGLEELNLEDSFHEWQTEENGEISKACFSDVTSLSALVTLNLKISKIGCLGKDIDCQWKNFTRFLLIFGNLDRSKIHISVSQCAIGVLISGSIPALSKWAENILLERVEGLQLRHCCGLAHVLSLGGSGRGFNKLRILHVDDCDGMVDSDPNETDGMGYLLSNCADKTFSSLEVLHLKSLPKLKGICCESVPMGCFNNLRILHLLDCGCPGSIICSELIAKLPNLEELVVWDCYKATEVFNSTTLNVEEGQATMEKLKLLKLLSLTSLRTIWKGVVLPLTLQHLEEIKVEDLGLNFMFSLAMAQRLQQLNRLDIRWCREMKKIISMEGDENTQGSSSSTRSDPSTSNISSSSLQFQISIFGNLRRLCIAGCNSLKQILPMSLAQGLLQLEVLDIRKCSNLEDIIVNDDDTKEKEAVCKTVFPKLRYLALQYLQNLSTVSKGMLSHDWPSLETLILWKCPKMEEFHVSLRTATKLKEIVVEKEWFDRLKLDDDKIKDKLSYLQEKGVKVIFEEYSGRSPDDR